VGYNYATLTHYDGSAWTSFATPGGVVKNYTISGLAGSASNDVWAITGPDIYRWDGTAWAVSSTVGGYHLALINNSDVWTEGSYNWNGTSWSPVTYGPMTSRTNIWGASSNDIWTVGNYGNITHWDGSAWNQVTSPTTATLQAVWGSSSTDVWAVGSGSPGAVIIHWNGTSLSPSLYDGMNVFNAVWASAPDSAWAVGTELLYWNGVTWTVVAPGSCAGAYQDVWGISRSDVWVVGSSGINGIACHYP
jgi:hypothetical protein